MTIRVPPKADAKSVEVVFTTLQEDIQKNV